MAKYRALRSCMAYPYDAGTPNIEPGIVFDVDERDPAAKTYIEALMETPGAVEKVGAKAEDIKPEDKGEGK